MAGDFRLHLGLLDDEQVVGDLLKVVDHIRDASPWFKVMHGWLEGEIAQQFASEGAHFGARWKALSPAYAAMKRADGYGSKPILERDGSLRKALTKSGAAGALRYTSPHLMMFGATVYNERGDGDVNLGVVHQRGTRDGRIPARKMLDLHHASQSRQIRRSAGLYFRTGELRPPNEMHGG